MNLAAPTKTQYLSTPNPTDTIHLKQIGDFEDKPRWNLTQVYAANSREFSCKRLALAPRTDPSMLEKLIMQKTQSTFLFNRHRLKRRTIES